MIQNNKSGVYQFTIEDNPEQVYVIEQQEGYHVICKDIIDAKVIPGYKNKVTGTGARKFKEVILDAVLNYQLQQSVEQSRWRRKNKSSIKVVEGGKKD